MLRGSAHFMKTLSRQTSCVWTKELTSSPNFQQPLRRLNVHEHVSYTLLKEAGIPVPKFGVAKRKEEASAIAKQLNTTDLVVKAQVLAGGRGKGRFKGGLEGGVLMCKTAAEAEELAGRMLGDVLITKQTGEEGKICNAVMITEKKTPKREFYFAIMMERAYGGPVLIASSKGGVNIEEVAAKNPQDIIYEPVDIMKGLSKESALNVTDKVGLKEKRDQVADILLKLYNLFITKDALLVEINPFAEDSSGNMFCLDCKMRFDDNADFRQKDLFALRDWTQVDAKEEEATKAGLNYIPLDGTIGCLVNGAGLAMATMDIIKFHGGNPANFLDVGGGASAEQVKIAFRLITSDPRVTSIFVNIFAGINRCDVIAEGIIAATKELHLTVPVICRIKGNMAEEGRKLIEKSGLKIMFAEEYDEAAELAVKVPSK